LPTPPVFEYVIRLAANAGLAAHRLAEGIAGYHFSTALRPVRSGKARQWRAIATRAFPLDQQQGKLSCL